MYLMEFSITLLQGYQSELMTAKDSLQYKQENAVKNLIYVDLESYK
jgi:hypothetical protein